MAYVLHVSSRLGLVLATLLLLELNSVVGPGKVDNGDLEERVSVKSRLVPSADRKWYPVEAVG